MTTTTKIIWVFLLIAACALALALFPRVAVALMDEPGALAGDEKLSCDEIYAQGMAIVQVEQQQREDTNRKIGAQTKATAALVGAAILVPTPATGIAAQTSAEGTIKNQIDLGVQAGAVKPDARKEHLRMLWTQKHCTKN